MGTLSNKIWNLWHWLASFWERPCGDPADTDRDADVMAAAMLCMQTGKAVIGGRDKDGLHLRTIERAPISPELPGRGHRDGVLFVPDGPDLCTFCFEPAHGVQFDRLPCCQRCKTEIWREEHAD